MNKITTHIVSNDDSDNQLIVEALDEPGTGGACHHYVIGNPNDLDDSYWPLDFQEGPIKEVGINGLTHEALLAVIIHRLQGFQSGQFANPKNKEALDHCFAALTALQSRTRDRIDRGVEGLLKA